jgi:hypothetical protein
METMSEFKVGAEIVRVANGTYYAAIGYKTTVLKDGKYKIEDSDMLIKIVDDQWELVEPKWTIYNNDKAWQDLSDKQKGKLLLAGHNGITISMSNGIFFKPAFSNGSAIYKAIKHETVKPEPTMEELFMADLSECNTGLLKHIPEPMIAKGWTKSC